MTLAEIKRWMWDASEADRWLLSANGTMVEGEKTLEQIDEYRNQHAESEIMVLHVSKQGDANPHWMRLKARPDKVKTCHLENLKQWLWREGLEDRWWLANATEIIGDYYTLNGIAQYQQEHAGEYFLVLHTSLSNEDPLPWVEISAE